VGPGGIRAGLLDLATYVIHRKLFLVDVGERLDRPVGSRPKSGLPAWWVKLGKDKDKDNLKKERNEKIKYAQFIIVVGPN